MRSKHDEKGEADGPDPLNVTQWQIPALYGLHWNSHTSGMAILTFQRGREAEVEKHLLAAIARHKPQAAVVAVPQIPAWEGIQRAPSSSEPPRAVRTSTPGTPQK